MGIQEWSAADIKNARSYFLEGLTIRDIAKELGRSVTATNKALSRFGIRFEKPRRNYTELQQPKKRIFSPIVAPSFERKALRQELESWVSFGHLCQYLSSQNICLYELSAPSIELDYRQFRVGTQVLNAGQLLVIANKIRTENNQKAFFVKGLSW
jgi:hypothetical protein